MKLIKDIELAKIRSELNYKMLNFNMLYQALNKRMLYQVLNMHVQVCNLRLHVFSHVRLVVYMWKLCETIISHKELEHFTCEKLLIQQVELEDFRRENDYLTCKISYVDFAFNLT